MLYLAVSIASLAVSLSIFLPYYSGLAEVGSALQFKDFVSMMNNAMVYYSSTFLATVPRGICNSTIGNGTMTIGQESLQIGGSISMGSALCANQGNTVMVSVDRQPDGSFIVADLVVKWK